MNENNLHKEVPQSREEKKAMYMAMKQEEVVEMLILAEERHDDLYRSIFDVLKEEIIRIGPENLEGKVIVFKNKHQ